ncbi:NUDIX hydrolase [Thioalkalicoccus limnaeus]|uniref:NUDIX hydrolase n=1 Tax=Thioalkalicoccus limnaeus TaxID=120681 RepID=A0ABV4B9V0_9GAMM
MHRQELLTRLGRYQTCYMEEAGHLSRARAFIAAHEDCFHCDLWPGHVTGSAWVVSPDRRRVLLMHHRKHDQWLQPGGHADGDADILRVALRETSEETGLDPSHVRLVDDRIFDVDIHTVPASSRGPKHEHIDIRFLVEMDDDLAIPGNDESHQILWVPLAEVSRYNNNRSTYRMVAKTHRLLTGTRRNAR